jgi:ATP-binding cassette subfamily F protein 3
LVGLLTEALNPQKGFVNRNGRLRLGLFSQHHVEQLELALSSVAFLQKQYPGLDVTEYRRILGRFGLTGTTTMRPIGTLSGGQKSRVVFASIAMMKPHVLILDEPSIALLTTGNHLDMDTISTLAEALKEFRGGLCVISHDQSFLDSVCNEIWVCNDTALTKFNGKDGDPTGIVFQYKRSLVG